MKHALSIGLALVALSGCNKKKEEAGAPPGTGTAAATPLDAGAAANAADAAPTLAPDAAEPAAPVDAAAPAGTTVLLEGLGEGGANIEIVAPAGATGNVFETEDTGIQARVELGGDKPSLDINKPPQMGPFDQEKQSLEKTFRIDWMEPDDGGWAAIYGAKKGRDKTFNVLVYRKAPDLVCYAGNLKTRADADAIVPICKTLRAAK